MPIIFSIHFFRSFYRNPTNKYIFFTQISFIRNAEIHAQIQNYRTAAESVKIIRKILNFIPVSTAGDQAQEPRK